MPLTAAPAPSCPIRRRLTPHPASTRREPRMKLPEPPVQSAVLPGWANLATRQHASNHMGGATLCMGPYSSARWPLPALPFAHQVFNNGERDRNRLPSCAMIPLSIPRVSAIRQVRPEISPAFEASQDLSEFRGLRQCKIGAACLLIMISFASGTLRQSNLTPASRNCNRHSRTSLASTHSHSKNPRRNLQVNFPTGTH
jgi:hypothetical protein